MSQLCVSVWIESPEWRRHVLSVSDSLDQGREAADTVTNEVSAVGEDDQVEEVVRNIITSVACLQSVECDMILSEDCGEFTNHVIMIWCNEHMLDMRIAPANITIISSLLSIPSYLSVFVKCWMMMCWPGEQRWWESDPCWLWYPRHWAEEKRLVTPGVSTCSHALNQSPPFLEQYSCEYCLACCVLLSLRKNVSLPGLFG